MYGNNWLAFKLLFVCELVGLTTLYVNGPHGIRVIYALEHRNRKLEHENSHLALGITKLEQELAAWTMDDFYKERVARERLQMARKDDEIYYLT